MKNRSCRTRQRPRLSACRSPTRSHPQGRSANWPRSGLECVPKAISPGYSRPAATRLQRPRARHRAEFRLLTFGRNKRAGFWPCHIGSFRCAAELHRHPAYRTSSLHKCARNQGAKVEPPSRQANYLRTVPPFNRPSARFLLSITCGRVLVR